MTAACVGRIVSRHSNKREEGMGLRSQVLGADLFKILRTVFFSETVMWRNCLVDLASVIVIFNPQRPCEITTDLSKKKKRKKRRRKAWINKTARENNKKIIPKSPEA